MQRKDNLAVLCTEVVLPWRILYQRFLLVAMIVNSEECDYNILTG